MAALNNISQAKKLFLAHYVEHGFVSAAAVHAGRTRKSIYDWRRDDPQFRADFEDCKWQYIEKLEAEADRRAVEGFEKPVYYKGQLVGSAKEYSDTLLMFRLKSLDSAKYREHVSAEFTGKNGRPLFMDLLEELRRLADDGVKPG